MIQTAAPRFMSRVLGSGRKAPADAENYSGRATLHLPIGLMARVDVTLSHQISFFSVAGDGDLTTEPDLAFEAMTCGEPVRLCLEDGTVFHVLITEARQQGDVGRCRFVIHS